mgnify:CR=1 FL=1
MDMFEPQQHPNDFPYPGGPPIPPYDNAGWTLAFQMGPRINARSRLDDPYAALHYMLAAEDGVARQHLQVLDDDNQARKALEADMVESARALAKPQLADDLPALVIHLPEGHAGVQGIVASRLVQSYGRPALVLTPATAPDMLTGSGRSIEALHLRDALQRAHELSPSSLPRFGGHRGAAGVGVPLTLAGAFVKGDTLRCAVTPGDGYDQGVAVLSNPVTIGNKLPVIGSVALEPSYGATCDTYTCIAEDVFGSSRNPTCPGVVGACSVGRLGNDSAPLPNCGVPASISGSKSRTVPGPHSWGGVNVGCARRCFCRAPSLIGCAFRTSALGSPDARRSPSLIKGP